MFRSSKNLRTLVGREPVKRISVHTRMLSSDVRHTLSLLDQVRLWLKLKHVVVKKTWAPLDLSTSTALWPAHIGKTESNSSSLLWQTNYLGSLNHCRCLNKNSNTRHTRSSVENHRKTCEKLLNNCNEINVPDRRTWV